MASTTGDADLRKENVDRAVKGFALQAYKMKQVVMIQKSNSWKETYFREASTELTGGTQSGVRSIPRLAAFPYGEPNWTEISARLEKYGMEGVVSWEDARTNEIDVMARTLLRIGRAVAKAVDDQIWAVISESQSASDLNSVTIAAGSEWDSDTIPKRDPIQNILAAKQAISEQNYDIDTNGWLLLNPKDFANLLGNANVRNAGQFFTDSPTRNGRVGMLLGLNVIVSNTITADYAMVLIGQEIGTWKQAQALTTTTIEDPAVNWTIRAWELGVAQLINPKAGCLIVNTAK